MKSLNKLSHSVWECKYHVVFTPKYRKKILYGRLRSYLGEVFHNLSSHRESKILEGHMMIDHVHMLIEIPPKYPIAKVIGYIKGKSSIHVAKEFEKRRNVTGHKLWSRGYFVSTVVRDENMIREYIRNQEVSDKRLDQMNLFNA